MKRSGFTLINAVISLLIVVILFTALAKSIALSNQIKDKLLAEQYLTMAMINFTESIQHEIRMGNEVTGQQLPMGDVRGDILIAKEYVQGDVAVYIVTYKLLYNNAKLNESVVLVAYE